MEIIMAFAVLFAMSAAVIWGAGYFNQNVK